MMHTYNKTGTKKTTGNVRLEGILHHLCKFYTACKESIQASITWHDLLEKIHFSILWICCSTCLDLGMISFHCHDAPFVQKVKESHFVA